MSVLRAFIAIELPSATQDAIRTQTASLKQALGQRVRWVPVGNIHLTLKFLGDIHTSHVEFINQMLAREAAAHAGFEVRISGLGAFPNLKRPRILWVGLQAPAALGALQRAIEAGAGRLGYEKEERPFSPHLTLGRVRTNLPLADSETIRHALEGRQLGFIPAIPVGSVHLFQSDLQPAGSVYTRLATFELAQAGAPAR